MNTLRRLTVLGGLCAALLSGCSDKPADATASGFASIDITGADYATGFQLTDHNGQQRTLADFKGKVVVVFFGYTQCPDVCPTSLGELAEAKRLLGADGDKLQGLFVSVDPARDTPEVMKQYMASFDPSFLALYTTADGLPELAKRFRVYYKKVDGQTATSYTMDHSAGSYVYDTQGRVRLYTRYGSGAPALAGDVKKLLAE
ncbi:SCO family protein [Hydrogenophaga sp.]|uniref:SCO family protein n=1 Tax=Hydrogenophaga sp. TaxID=1904254 RepID=UPI00286DE9E0|nr:SCO family protein [Hydrogenophaga sp.]